MNVNNFEEDLHLQQIKVDRLSTFNKELRSKLDYFVSLLQTMNAYTPQTIDDTTIRYDDNSLTNEPPPSYLSRPTSK